MKMPRITPRKTEVESVVSILESGEHADAKSMAKAIVAELFARFQERDLWIVAERNDGLNIIYGVFGSEKAAIKAVNTLGLFGEVGVFKVRSAADRALRFEEQEVARDPDMCRCGHLKAAHEFPRRKGCVAKGCGCKTFDNTQ